MKLSLEAKLKLRREAYVSRIATVYEETEEDVRARFSTSRKQCFRINPLMASSDADKELIKSFSPVAWTRQFGFESYLVDGRMGELYDLQKRGVLFIQNASSWLPVLALEPQADETIYDVCAAPGAKTSFIAAQTGNSAIITANDVSPARLGKLKSNLTTLGAINVSFTIGRAEIGKKIADKMYDKILLDVPCSGDGMVNLTDTASLSTWSIKAVERLSSLQTKLLYNAWRQLKIGGDLVYSTCTVAPEENELVINYFLKRHENAELISIMLPEEIPRGQIVGKWRKQQISDGVRQKTIRVKQSGIYEAFYLAKLKKIA